MIAVLAIPKPFSGHVGIIQRNAVRSWRRFLGDAEIFLCGDEDGTADVARTARATHVPDIECNEFGTPLLNSAFREVAGRTDARILCYVNADVLLFPDLVAAAERLAMRDFLMVARRRCVEISEDVSFSETYPTRDAFASRFSLTELDSSDALDVFVLTRTDVLLDILPFAVGRPGWDNWYVYNALKHRIPVVDATDVVTVVHQRHDYGHVAGAGNNDWGGPEGDRNIELAGGWANLFTIADATHALTRHGCRVAREREHVHRRIERLRRFRPHTFRCLTLWKLRYAFCYLYPWL